MVVITSYGRDGGCHGNREGCDDEEFHIWLRSVFRDDDGDDGFTGLDDENRMWVRELKGASHLPCPRYYNSAGLLTWSELGRRLMFRVHATFRLRRASLFFR